MYKNIGVSTQIEALHRASELTVLTFSNTSIFWCTTVLGFLSSFAFFFKMKLIPTLLFGIATTGVSALVAERSNTPAPYHRPDSEHLVPEGYIVRFRPNHTMEDHITNLGFDIRQFASAFLEITLANSYMFHLTEANNSLVHDAIRHDPGVLRIEHDEYLHHEELGQMSTTGPRTDFVNKSKRWVSKVMRSHAPWNQVMISLGSKRNFGGESEVGKPFHSQFYLKNSGAGVNVYVLDTGIKIEHDTFQVDRSTSIASHFKGLKSSDVSPYCKFNDINRFMVRFPSLDSSLAYFSNGLFRMTPSTMELM